VTVKSAIVAASRLIMVSGSAPGAGKSRLAAAIARELGERGARVRALSEDDLLASEGFARFERSLGPSDPEESRADLALLEATGRLVDDVLAVSRPAGDRQVVTITDALLPGFFWLFGRHYADRVREVGEELAELLRPLDAVTVYLRGDPAALFTRTTAARGAQWPAWYASRVARWALPHYPDGPVRTLDEVLRFVRWVDEMTLVLLAEWPVDTLVVDATRPFDEVVGAVMGDSRVSR
jgi:hypothetical protein